MSEALKRAVQAAVLRLLGPLVNLLLDAGIGVGDLMSLVKVAYVREARKRGPDAGGARGPNVTRIAVVTGMTRVEVAEILRAGDGAFEGSDRGRQRAERVLSGWWNDPDFQDELGQPAVLPVRGARRSFASLCERYSGDPPFPAILDELIRVHAVRRSDDGKVKALSRTYATVRWDPDGVAAVGEELADHCTTLLHNLRSPSRPLLTRRVVNARLNPRFMPMLIRDFEEQASAMAESMDDELNDPEHTVTGRAEGARDAVRFGVGIYFFESSEEAASSAAGTRAVAAVRERVPAGRRRRATGAGRR